MKTGFILIWVLAFSGTAQAELEESSFYNAGLRLGVGYNMVEYEQKISDTGTNFTTDAQEISYLHLSFASQMSSQLWFLLYGSLGTITFDTSPSGQQDEHTSMTGDVNLETRFTFSDYKERESWVPFYIIGVNANYMPIVRVPQTAGATYEYDLVPLVSPVIGITTTVWGERSAWRNTLRLAIPMLSESALDVRSGYNLMAVTAYTFALGEHMSMGVEGHISYAALKLTEVSPVTSQDVEHKITRSSVGPRVFFTINF